MGWSYHNKPPMGWPLDYDSGLVPEAAFWPFNEGSGGQVFDLSGNGNTGTLVANTHWVSGKFGSALDFDGIGDNVNMGDLDIIGDKLVISIWFMWRSGGPNPVLISKGYTDIFYLHVIAASSELVLYINGNPITSGANSISQDVWTHAMVRYNGVTKGIYINGILAAEDAESGNLATNNNDLTIGDRSSDYARPFKGLVDNVDIFKRDLSASAIALLYREPFRMFKDPDGIPVLDQYYTVTEGGIMTPNTRYWGAL